MERPRSRHFAHLLDEMVDRNAASDFLVFRGEAYSYAEFQLRARQLAKGLYAYGVRPGDRVALLVSNRPEWFELTFATFQLGATVVPLTTWSRTWDLAYTLSHSRAKILISIPSFKGNDYVDYLHQLAPELNRQDRMSLRLDRFGDLERIVMLDDPGSGSFLTLAEVLDAGTGTRQDEFEACEAAAAPEDLAYILYTSGSTARAKGVMVEHWGCVENGFMIGERQHYKSDDRLWMAVPLAWGLGAENALPAIMTHGGAIVLQESFEPGEALRLFNSERVSVVYATPNMVQALIEDSDFVPKGYPTLRTGATIGNPEELRRAIEVLGVPKMCNIYGATETYGNCCLTDADEPAEVRFESQGTALPGTTIRIVDTDTGEPAPSGVAGEVVVSGYVVPGYWDDAEQTAAAFPRPRTFRTGDLAFMDSDEHFHFVARVKEMIKSGGINIAPAEVESFLMTHPSIKAAYVVGVPDPRKGEATLAFVEVAGNTDLTADEIVEYSKARIASYKIPDRIVFISEADVPRTSTGKVNKSALTSHARHEGGQ